MIQKYLSLVKFAHTIFALPFAITGFVLGWIAVGTFDWKLFLLVLGCMVTARNAAMSFNRYIDRDIDAKNVRTKVREIPAGNISAGNALAFCLINSGLFILCTFFINWACFFLSPVALAVILGYSYTKRFTALCHLVLGLGLALAPVGAFLALTGYFHFLPILLGLAVLTWVSGFDIIYALQDVDFDKGEQLHSIPTALGKKRALRVSEFLHLLSAAAILIFCWQIQAGVLSWIGGGIFVALLVYQHTLVKTDDLSKVNLAFFTTNGIASVVFAVMVIGDILLRVYG